LAVSTAATATSAATAPGQKQLTLEITSWLGQPPSLDVYKQLNTAYAKMQPGIAVKQQVITDNYASKLTALLAGGTPPDLCETNWIESQALGTKGALQPLDPMLSRDKINVSDYMAVAQELGRWPQQTGKYYAWYTMFATSPLFYNTALFSAAGVPPPDESWTWQHLLEAAQKLSKPGDSPQDSVYGFHLTYFTRTLLYSFGWDYFSPDLSTCLLDSSDSIDALQFWQDLIYKYQVSPASAGDFAKGDQYGPFATKRLGMAIAGSYQIAQFRTVQGLDWDIAVPPSGPKGRIVIIKGAPAHSLPAQSPHAQDAWAFLSWWTRNQTPDLVVLPGNLPSRLSALSGWVAEQKKGNATPAHIELVYDIASKYGKPIQVLPNNDPVKKPYYDERALILANKEDARTGMTKACSQMTTLLKQAQAGGT